MRRAFLLVALLAAGCGSRGKLTPEAGHSLPPAPVFAKATPTPDEMLVPPPEAAPNRVDDIIKRPERERPADPFDLPPSQ